MIRSLFVLSAGAVALAIASAAKADNDLIRLDGKGDAEVQETRYGGGGFRGGVGFGGYRGGFGGYRGGFGGYRGGFGGYGRGYGYGGIGFGRPYYGYYGRSYYRPYYGFGYGLGVGLGLGYGGYYGGGYGGYGYGGGYGGYYGTYNISPYYNSAYSLGPCASDMNFPAATTLNFAAPNVPQGLGDGTFPYDGGPRDGFFAPVPAGIPNGRVLPRDGHLVSVPATSSGYHFLAFGEQSAPASERPTTGNSSDTLRVSYPAYGESTSGFSGGTSLYPPILR